MNCQKWDNAENSQEFASSVPMETFIHNIAKLFIFQYFSIDVNELPYNSETYISGCRCETFWIRYGCLSLKAKGHYSTYEKFPWKQKSCDAILFLSYMNKDSELLKRLAQ